MTNYVGKYLIARPTIEYGFFKHSVIFLYEHSRSGSGGVALHTPTNLHFSVIAAQFGVEAQTQDPIIYQGGPVNKQSLLMLHSDDFSSTNTLHTGVGLDVSSDSLMVEKLCCSAWPRYYRLVTGISVWAPGQLEFEIEKLNWLVADLPREMVFSTQGENLWTLAVDHVSRSTFDQYI